MDHRNLLNRTAELAIEFLDGLPERRVGSSAPIEELRAALGGSLPERGEEAREVVERLAQAADPGLVAMAGPRYFGFVVGGHVAAAAAILRAFRQAGSESTLKPSRSTSGVPER